MSAKAGEVARETALYRCESCGHRVEIKVGALIGECEACGSASFKTGWSTSSTRSPRAQAEALFAKVG